MRTCQLAWRWGHDLRVAQCGPRTFRYLAGTAALSVVLIYLAVNIATIRAFRTEFRDQFRLGRHLLLPAAATALFLFPLWGDPSPERVHPGEPAALRGARMAMSRRDRRRRPAGKTARTPRGTRQSIHPSDRPADTTDESPTPASSA